MKAAYSEGSGDNCLLGFMLLLWDGDVGAPVDWLAYLEASMTSNESGDCNSENLQEDD